MKRIGTDETGNAIVVMPVAMYDLIDEVQKTLIQIQSPAPAPQAPPAPPPPQRRKVGRGLRTAPRTAGTAVTTARGKPGPKPRRLRQPPNREKVCKWCRQPFHDGSKTNTMTACLKPECREKQAAALHRPSAPLAASTTAGTGEGKPAAGSFGPPPGVDRKDLIRQRVKALGLATSEPG